MPLLVSNLGIKQSSSVGKSIQKLRDFALHMSSVRYDSISIGQGKQENLSREGKLRCNSGITDRALLIAS